MKRSSAIDLICYAIVLLFFYAALSKLFTFNIYLHDLYRSPFINHFAPILSILIPGIEMATAIMLLIERTRLLGLISATILMIMFSIYVALIVGTVDHVPCTCGGLIRELSWPQHLIFNLFYTAIAALGVLMQRKEQLNAESAKSELGRS